LPGCALQRGSGTLGALGKHHLGMSYILAEAWGIEELPANHITVETVIAISFLRSSMVFLR
jgi:hypothetical protein